MWSSMPLIGRPQALKICSAEQRGIQRKHSHHEDAAQASRKDDSTQRRLWPTSGAASEAKQRPNSSAPLGKRAAKRAAATAVAAQKGSAQADSMMQPKTRNARATPPVAEPSPSSPSKGKSGRSSKHELTGELPFTSPGPSQAASTAPSSSSPLTDFHTSIMPAPASSLALASS